MTLDPSALLKMLLWLAVLGGAVIISAKLVGTAGKRAAAAL